ncbi:hypothetical protein J3L16_15105, partial [Alteromonas sp. 5E99-2]|nr:hypothetical protein [Alteromonas sp. 5E99-2]
MAYIKSIRNSVSSIYATENYSYDSLHRLTHSSISKGATSIGIDYGYDAVGNLLKKTDYSTNSNSAYKYVANSHKLNSVALKQGGTATFDYDSKGNLTHRNNTREVTYNVFNKPTNITRLGSEVDLTYGADIMRVKQQ